MAHTSTSSLITLKFDETEIGSTDAPKEISVHRNTVFNAIFDDYEMKNSFQHKKLNYVYRCRLIKDTETPLSLKMNDGDTIKVVHSNSNLNYTNAINKSAKITLSLIDPEGTEHLSEIKVDRKIKNWLKAQCQSLDLNYDSLSFFVNNNLIDVERTPHQLKLSNNDKVTAINRKNSKNDDIAIKCHDIQTNHYAPPTNTTPLTHNIQEPSTINLIIKGPNGEKIQAQVNPDETFKHSFKPLLKDYNFKVTDYHFVFNNSSLNGNDTPNDLRMKEGDIIKMKKKKDHKRHSTDSKTEENPASSCLLI